MRPKVLSQLLSTCIQERLPILITGAPGIGKSDIVASAAGAADADLIVSHPVVSDPTDFKGLPGIVDGAAEFLPFGDLRAMVQASKPTVAFLDDLGQAPAVVQAAAMQLLLARRVNGHRVSDHVTFVAATNRRQDRAGVAGILEPVKSRFTSIVELEAHLDDWTAWALSHGVPTELISFLRFRPALLSDFRPTADLVNSPCPRTWAFCGRLITAGRQDLETLRGAVGEGAATELVAFLRIVAKLPSPDAILLNPDQADVPDDPATLYALTGALIARGSTQTAGAILRYSDRLPAEFSVLTVRDLARKCPAVTSTRPFVEWASNHSDVLL